MDKFKKIKKQIRDEAEENFDIYEDSDIPISEKKVKDKKIRWI